MNTGARLAGLDEAQQRVLDVQRKLHEWAPPARRARGEPDAGELARPVRRAAAEKPPAARLTRRSAVDPYIDFGRRSGRHATQSQQRSPALAESGRRAETPQAVVRSTYGELHPTLNGAEAL